MREILFLAVLLVVLFSGCSQISGSATGTLSTDKIKQYLGGDPDIVVTSKEFSLEEISTGFESLNSACNGTLEKKPYTVFAAKSEQVDLQIFFDNEKDQVVCTIRNQKEILLDSCQSDAQCDDGFLSTIDRCDGSPKKCVNERTTECREGDNFCPATCMKKNDSDCLRECLSDEECNDDDPTTQDTCGGAIQVCSNETILVEGSSAIACSADSDCVSENFCKAGSCSEEGLCSFENMPDGAFCDRLKGCFEGECGHFKDQLLFVKSFDIKYIGNNSAEISWSSPFLTTAEIRWGISITFPKTETIDSLTTENSFVITTLSKGLEYFYEVSVFDAEKVNTSKTPTINFKTCLTECDDANTCTLDSCDLKTGQCINSLDTQNTSCQ